MEETIAYMKSDGGEATFQLRHSLCLSILGFGMVIELKSGSKSSVEDTKVWMYP